MWYNVLQYVCENRPVREQNKCPANAIVIHQDLVYDMISCGKEEA